MAQWSMIPYLIMRRRVQSKLKSSLNIHLEVLFALERGITGYWYWFNKEKGGGMLITSIELNKHILCLGETQSFKHQLLPVRRILRQIPFVFTHYTCLSSIRHIDRHISDLPIITTLTEHRQNDTLLIHTEIHSDAYSTTRAKGKPWHSSSGELVIFATRTESFGIKDFRVLPHSWVVMQLVDIKSNRLSLGNEYAIKVSVLSRLPSKDG